MAAFSSSWAFFTADCIALSAIFSFLAAFAAAFSGESGDGFVCDDTDIEW
jgi:hypothetical protein